MSMKIQKVFDCKVPVAEILALPTIKALAEYIAGAGEARFSEIEVLSEEEYYPVSSVEKRLYALDQMPGIGTAYHITMPISLEGILDYDRLNEAINEVIRRHEALRSSFEVVEGELLKRVYKQLKYQLVLKECSEEELDKMIREFVQTFDLSEPPLFKAGLLSLSLTRHVLIFKVHHIIFDGVSLRIFMEELLAIYSGKKLPTVKHQYRNFAVWHNNLIESELIKSQENYWLEHLSGELPILNLPTDFLRPAARSYAGECFDITIGRELSKQLHKLAIDSNSTMFMLLLAAYYILLSRYSGQEDIIVGSPASGRSHADLQGTLGMFVNTLPLRNYPAGTKTFQQFLKEVQQCTTKAIDNQDYPFEYMLNKLKLHRDASRSLLIDVIFTIENEQELPQVAEFQVKPYPVSNKSAQFDLSLFVKELSEEFLCSFNYAAKLFKQDTICRMSRHYLNILQEIVQAPQKTISEICMLSNNERKQLLEGFNGPELPYPKEKTVQELFATQVEKYPEKLALVFKDQQYTYKQLAEKTDRLAMLLRSKGVKPNTIVPILLDRCAEYVIGILSIIKAGGAYLPIDPTYPNNRIAYMLEDSGAAIILSKVELKEKFSSFQGEWLDLNDTKLYQRTKTQELELLNIPQDLVGSLTLA